MKKQLQAASKLSSHIENLISQASPHILPQAAISTQLNYLNPNADSTELHLSAVQLLKALDEIYEDIRGSKMLRAENASTPLSRKLTQMTPKPVVENFTSAISSEQILSEVVSPELTLFLSADAETPLNVRDKLKQIEEQRQALRNVIARTEKNLPETIQKKFLASNIANMPLNGLLAQARDGHLLLQAHYWPIIAHAQPTVTQAEIREKLQDVQKTFFVKLSELVDNADSLEDLQTCKNFLRQAQEQFPDATAEYQTITKQFQDKLTEKFTALPAQYPLHLHKDENFTLLQQLEKWKATCVDFNAIEKLYTPWVAQISTTLNQQIIDTANQQVKNAESTSSLAKKFTLQTEVTALEKKYSSVLTEETKAHLKNSHTNLLKDIEATLTKEISALESVFNKDGTDYLLVLTDTANALRQYEAIARQPHPSRETLNALCQQLKTNTDLDHHVEEKLILLAQEVNLDIFEKAKMTDSLIAALYEIKGTLPPNVLNLYQQFNQQMAQQIAELIFARNINNVRHIDASKELSADAVKGFTKPSAAGNNKGFSQLTEDSNIISLLLEEHILHSDNLLMAGLAKNRLESVLLLSLEKRDYLGAQTVLGTLEKTTVQALKLPTTASYSVANEFLSTADNHKKLREIYQADEREHHAYIPSLPLLKKDIILREEKIYGTPESDDKKKQNMAEFMLQQQKIFEENQKNLAAVTIPSLPDTLTAPAAAFFPAIEQALRENISSTLQQALTAKLGSEKAEKFISDFLTACTQNIQQQGFEQTKILDDIFVPLLLQAIGGHDANTLQEAEAIRQLYQDVLIKNRVLDRDRLTIAYENIVRNNTFFPAETRLKNTLPQTTENNLDPAKLLNQIALPIKPEILPELKQRLAATATPAAAVVTSAMESTTSAQKLTIAQTYIQRSREINDILDSAKLQQNTSDNYGITTAILASDSSTSKKIEVRQFAQDAYHRTKTEDIKARVNFLCDVAEKVLMERSMTEKKTLSTDRSPTLSEKHQAQLEKINQLRDIYLEKIKSNPSLQLQHQVMNDSLQNSAAFKESAATAQQLFSELQELLLISVYEQPNKPFDQKVAANHFAETAKELTIAQGRPHIVHDMGNQIGLVSAHFTKGKKTYPNSYRSSEEAGVNPNSVFHVIGVKQPDGTTEVASTISRASSQSVLGIKERERTVERVRLNYENAKADLLETATRLAQAANLADGATLVFDFDTNSLLTPIMGRNAEKIFAHALHWEPEVRQLKDHHRAWMMLHQQEIALTLPNGKTIKVKPNIRHMNFPVSYTGVVMAVPAAVQQYTNARGFAQYVQQQHDSLRATSVEDINLTSILSLLTLKTDETLQEKIKQKEAEFVKLNAELISFAQSGNTSAEEFSQREKALIKVEQALAQLYTDASAPAAKQWKNPEFLAQVEKFRQDAITALTSETLAPQEKIRLQQALYYLNVHQQYATNNYHKDSKDLYLFAAQLVRSSEMAGNAEAVNCKSSKDRTGWLLDHVELLIKAEHDKDRGQCPLFVANTIEKTAQDTAYVTKWLPKIHEYSASLESIGHNSPGARGNRLNDPWGNDLSKIDKKTSLWQKLKPGKYLALTRLKKQIKNIQTLDDYYRVSTEIGQLKGIYEPARLNALHALLAEKARKLTQQNKERFLASEHSEKPEVLTHAKEFSHALTTIEKRIEEREQEWTRTSEVANLHIMNLQTIPPQMTPPQRTSISFTYQELQQLKTHLQQDMSELQKKSAAAITISEQKQIAALQSKLSQWQAEVEKTTDTLTQAIRIANKKGLIPPLVLPRSQSVAATPISATEMALKISAPQVNITANTTVNPISTVDSAVPMGKYVLDSASLATGELVFRPLLHQSEGDQATILSNQPYYEVTTQEISGHIPENTDATVKEKMLEQMVRTAIQAFHPRQIEDLDFGSKDPQLRQDIERVAAKVAAQEPQLFTVNAHKIRE